MPTDVTALKQDLTRRMEGAMETLKKEFSGLRTGRASPALLEPVRVEAYGSVTPLNQVANVTVPEPRMLGVSIWDKSMVNAVDRAIREANLGLNPMSEGQLPLTYDHKPTGRGDDDRRGTRGGDAVAAANPFALAALSPIVTIGGSLKDVQFGTLVVQDGLPC